MIALFGSKVGSEELEAVGDCIDRQWLGIGPRTDEFERRMAEKLGTESFVFLNSGSNSLQMAIKLLNLPKESEVILPSLTWVACANAVCLNELKPVFCDVDLNTHNIRPEDVEEKLSSKTSAIMVVHYAGKPVDMDAFNKFNLPIIEDAAHAIDSFYKGKHCGTLGDVAIFSFDAVKNLTTGEGGGLVVKDSSKYEIARKLRYCGIGKSGFQASATKTRWWEYQIGEPFPKMLNNDIAASIGLAQLRKLSGFQARRKKLWEIFTDRINSEDWASSWLVPPVGPSENETHSYFTFCVRLISGDRDNLARFLYNKGIYTSLRFHPLHMNPIYQHKGSLPNCEKFNDMALNLPFHHRLSDEEVDTIFSCLKEFREKHL